MSRDELDRLTTLAQSGDADAGFALLSMARRRGEESLVRTATEALFRLGYWALDSAVARRDQEPMAWVARNQTVALFLGRVREGDPGQALDLSVRSACRDCALSASAYLGDALDQDLELATALELAVSRATGVGVAGTRESRRGWSPSRRRGRGRRRDRRRRFRAAADGIAVSRNALAHEGGMVAYVIDGPVIQTLRDAPVWTPNLWLVLAPQELERVQSRIGIPQLLSENTPLSAAEEIVEQWTALRDGEPVAVLAAKASLRPLPDAG